MCDFSPEVVAERETELQQDIYKAMQVEAYGPVYIQGPSNNIHVPAVNKGDSTTGQRFAPACHFTRGMHLYVLGV